MQYFCECQDLKCLLKVEVSDKIEAELDLLYNDLTVIVDGCQRGPLPTQELVETCDGFKVYREKGAS